MGQVPAGPSVSEIPRTRPLFDATLEPVDNPHEQEMHVQNRLFNAQNDANMEKEDQMNAALNIATNSQ